LDIVVVRIFILLSLILLLKPDVIEEGVTVTKADIEGVPRHLSAGFA
jgi:hypothetical protein